MNQNGELTYQKPLNFREEWAHLFRDDFKYKKVHLKIRKLNKVFVNHYGIVIKNGLLVKGCAPNTGCSTYDKGFYLKHWRKGIEQFLVCNYGKSLEQIKLDPSNKYLLIHSPWFSYYFWVTECLPRLISTQELHDDVFLIYPENWKDIEFVNATLNLFPNLRKFIVPRDVHMSIDHLVLPEVKPWTIMFIPSHVRTVNSFLFKNLKNKGQNTPKRICITRQGRHRSFENFEEVRELLLRYDFEMIKMEEYSFLDQIALMANCECAMGISGAGHTNIHFMREGSHFLDITAKRNLESKKYKLHFWKLANIVGVKYLLQTAEISTTTLNKDIPYFNRNIIIDLKLLEQNIKLMIHE